MTRALACIVALHLGGCADYHLEAGLTGGAPGASGLTSLPVGTAAMFSGSEVHRGAMETTITYATEVHADDPSILTVIHANDAWVVVALREGDTVLRVVAGSTYPLPVHVVAQP